MGISKSTQFERFDRNLSPTSKKLTIIKNNFNEKHLPEYPPLQIYKDSSTQTISSSKTLLLSTFNSSFYQNKKFFYFLLLIYCFCLICMICSNTLHTILIYMNLVNFPFVSLSNLNYYGLYNGRNIKYTTEDGVIIHGWHILPPGDISFTSSKMKNKILKEKYFIEQLQQATTIVIQLHGNAANRGIPRRIELMKQLSSELSAHVIAIDYRGFGDSTGWPSQNGTTKDMFGLWKWLETTLTSNQTASTTAAAAHRPKIIIYGLSLGTGIAVEFLYHLTKQHQQQFQQLQSKSSQSHSHSEQEEHQRTPLYPSGLILNSPFSSIRDAIHDYPAALPLRIIPFAERLMSSFLSIDYSTIDHIHTIQCPILILHGTDDKTIPIHQSRKILKSYESHFSHLTCDASHTHIDHHNTHCDTSSSSSNSTSHSSTQPIINPCSLRIKAVENGDAFSGMECLASLPNNNNHNNQTLPIISLVELPFGTHENVFRLNEWMVTVPDFVQKCK